MIKTKKLQTLQVKDMILLLENIIRGGTGCIMGDRYVNSDENKRKLSIDANNLYRHSMSQPLLYDEIEFDENVKVEHIINTPDDSDIRYIVEVEAKYPEGIKHKTQKLPFCAVNKNCPQGKLTVSMIENKPNTYTQNFELVCDCTDKKNYLIHYRMLKFFMTWDDN